ncbi:vWA domain-containing protein [Pseudooctadecabacter jejudonensis]|uniref:VWA domain containing CoxE-like protein n=1 Tax=Pseudooctadecabacter jejudonensis TaxID=1391910 RepID=A0A1Y5TA07_9RHOB|nr:VWA domain-containing protein [Pseudooctadecabacter jejudonensis]SLN58907.1 VWA domain containing CoxE-like protein [Pseudooctadecabacter jejudonensis]
MVALPPLDIPEDGALARNITHFARALRRAGIPIGPARTVDAIAAVAAAGFTKREDFFHTLQACFVSKPDHRAVFAQTFRLYWRDPQYLEHMMSLLIPQVQGLQDDRRAAPAEKRAAQALLDQTDPITPETAKEDAETEIDIDASHTMSTQDVLRTLDFEQMSAPEMAEALRLLSKLTLPVTPVPSRRTVRGVGPLPDWRETLRRANRQGGEIRAFVTRRKRIQPPDLVVLCDISGSMSAYSRAVLHFAHTLANSRTEHWGQLHAFTFGTTLTNITRHLRTRDVDAALAAAGAQAQDWEGGTRIGHCVDRFNRDWARRILGQGAVVVLITDGLDRDAGDTLGAAMRRLSLTARQVIWLNPLLRWADFAPKARGIRTMLPHVNTFRAGHNIASLEGLAAALSDPRDTGDKTRMMALIKADDAAPKDTLGWQWDQSGPK